MFGVFLVPVLVAFGFVSLCAGLMLWAKYLYKTPPDKVAIITGRKHKLPDGSVVGYRIVRGGATFVWPIRETIQYVPLTLMTVPISVRNAYNKDGVPVDIDAIANVKIKGEDQAISNAVERFLENPSKIEDTVKQTLEGHLRSIVGRLTVEELNSDRKAFAATVTEEAVVDLEKMGIGADSIVIQKIEDKQGYLEALGKKRTAEVKRDADIGEAEAKAEARKKSSEAIKQAETVAAVNDQMVALAQKERDVKKAEYQAEVNAQIARTEQAGLLAKAEAEKDVLIAQQTAKEAEAKAGVEVKKQEALRKKEELSATKVKEAEADKEAAIAKSEGEKQSAILEAEGKKESAEREAEAIKVKALAEADGNKAKLIAAADGEKAQLLAEAAGIQAKLEAEAEGIRKKAEAMRELNAAAQWLLLMEKSPEVIKALGEAGGEITKGIFESIARPLGSVDSITIYDSGNGDGNGAVARMADIVPGILFNFIAKCKANGMNDLAELVQNLLSSAASKLVTESAVARPNSEDKENAASVN